MVKSKTRRVKPLRSALSLLADHQAAVRINSGRTAASESPDQPGRSAVIILRRTQQMSSHVIEFQTPGKVMEKEKLKFAIHAATRIF